MAKTSIEWTDRVWNTQAGCSLASPGCTNCYAMGQAARNFLMGEGQAKKTGKPNAMEHYRGLTRLPPLRRGPVWTGKIGFAEHKLLEPLTIKKPCRWFVNSMSDLFHDDVPNEWIDRVFAVMALAPHHTFQVLTKRSKRMREYVTRGGPTLHDIAKVPQIGKDAMVMNDVWPLPNVWLGVSVEDQKRADERIPDLLATPAAVRWISAEPLLGPVDLINMRCDETYSPDSDPHNDLNALTGKVSNLAVSYSEQRARLDWIICGGESGPNARPMHPDWARSLRDQCASAGVAFLFKQWGEWVPQVGAVDGWTIDDNPEISRFDHRDWNGDAFGKCYRPMWDQERDDDTVSRIGKKAAGRLLDGVEHNAMPEPAHAAR